MIKHLIYIVIFTSSALCAQGVINNGASLVFSDGIQVVVDGNSGNFTNENSGTITNNSGSNSLFVKGNWTNNASNTVFTNDGVSTELNGAAQTIGGTNSTTFYNLSLTGTGTKTLNQATKVGGISTLDGVLNLKDRQLDLNQHTLEITNPTPSAISRTSGIVISETNTATNPSIIQWNTDASAGNYVFPFGASGDYIPVILNKTSSLASAISISTRATTADNNIPWTSGVSNMVSVELGIPDASQVTTIDRWYEINSSAPLIADLTLSYRGAENTTSLSPTGTFAMQRWNGAWENQLGSGSGVTTGVGSITANSVSDFSTFVLTTFNTFGPLPVVLTQFSAICEKGETVIRWTTASESNSDKFVVKRSRDGINWLFVGELSAAGNSYLELNYILIDSAPFQGINYYQLEQYDLNGDLKTYNPISSNCESSTVDNSLSVYPNPTKNGFKVEINQFSLSENANIQILDISGKIIEKRAINIESGTNQYLFETENLAPGTYIIHILSTQKYKPIKLVVLN